MNMGFLQKKDAQSISIWAQIVEFTGLLINVRKNHALIVNHLRH
jgi:hypothetical protein